MKGDEYDYKVKNTNIYLSNVKKSLRQLLKEVRLYAYKPLTDLA